MFTTSKNYLVTKGLTDSEIDSMVLEENGTELDLIPLVMAMVSIENSETTVFNYSDFFVTSAYSQSWSDVGNCAMIAIGADILWSLGGSTASSWTKKAIKKAFGAVAKRFLGPIGVAIAVISFTLCMHQAYIADA